MTSPLVSAQFETNETDPSSMSDSVTTYENVRGGAGDDRVEGTELPDYLYGDQGNDLLFGFQGHDVMRGGIGDDTLHGGQGDDVLESDAGNDSLFGDRHNDYLDGGDGNDTLDGGNGRDMFVDSKGNDVYIGGQGQDTISFAGFSGDDTVTDFTVGDTIILERFTNEGFPDITTFQQLLAHASNITVDGHAAVKIQSTVDTDHSITLLGLSTSTLDSQMFVYVNAAIQN